MSIKTNAEDIRNWTDKLKAAPTDKDKLEALHKLNQLWLDREILFDTDTSDMKQHYRGYAAGMAEGYRMMIYLLTDELDCI